MNIESLRYLLDALDNSLEVRIAVEERKENRIRDRTIIDEDSQLLVGIAIKNGVLYLRGQK